MHKQLKEKEDILATQIRNLLPTWPNEKEEYLF